MPGPGVDGLLEARIERRIPDVRHDIGQSPIQVATAFIVLDRIEALAFVIEAEFYRHFLVFFVWQVRQRGVFILILQEFLDGRRTTYFL